MRRRGQLAVKKASVSSSQDDALQQAMAASLDESMESIKEETAVHQAIKASEQELVTPRMARADSNAVRAFEQEFSGTAGKPEGVTAAAARSRANTAASSTNGRHWLRA